MTDLQNSQRTGIAGGILTSILANIGLADLVQSAALAATGTLVSFLASYALRWCVRRWRR